MRANACASAGVPGAGLTHISDNRLANAICKLRRIGPALFMPPVKSPKMLWRDQSNRFVSDIVAPGLYLVCRSSMRCSVSGAKSSLSAWFCARLTIVVTATSWRGVGAYAHEPLVKSDYSEYVSLLRTFGLKCQADSENNPFASMSQAARSSATETGVSGWTAPGSPLAEREIYSPPIQCAGIVAQRR